ncbi:MAG: NADH-quinone oxidoreductase subunit L, partial [Ignavibacteriaceae bacterium]|nr:NADH-quinone oxidoreductase subunit L [Ignavibacteriaceae bacterium]
MTHYIFLTVLLPFLGFLVNGLFGSRIKNEKIIGWIGSGTVGFSFLIVVITFFQTLALPAYDRKSIVTLFNWLNVGELNINISYQVDQLSLIMALIV